MNKMRYNIRKKLRKAKFWMIKKACTEEEWKVLRNVRMNYYGQVEEKRKVHIVNCSFELNQASYDFLHSAEGQQKYDAQYGIAHKLIRDNEDEIAKHVFYIEAYDAKRKIWVCTAELNLMEVKK